MKATRVGVAAVLAATLVGCSTTVAGSLVLTTAPAPAGAVDLALLDPGNYPTKPRAPLGIAGDTHNAALLEGARLGNNVVGPWEVDPALIAHPHAGVKASDFAKAFSVDAAQAALDHKLVALFTTTRFTDPEDRNLINVVMRFPSPEEATTAAADITAASINFRFGDQVTVYDPTPIPRYPDTAGMVHHWDKLGTWSVQAFTAHGTYVLCQYADSKESAEPAAELVAATLDRQGPLIDEFQPTPIDQLADLPIDTDGALARTLPPEKDNGEVYQPRAQLHFDSDPIRSKTLFDTAHLQLVSKGRASVYQTPDAASAKTVVDGFATEVTEKGLSNGTYVPAAGVKGMPGSKCFTHKDQDSTFFYCLAAADRYAIEVGSLQELDAHQMVAAQYLMLTSKP